ANGLPHFLVLDRLAIGWWRRLCGRCIDATGHDAETVKLCPQRLHGVGIVAVEVTAANAHELPARSLKIALPRHILFIAVGTMPLVTIAFDGEASLHTLNNQINTVAMIGRIAYTYLRAHMKAPGGNQLKNLAFKPGLEPLVPFLRHEAPGIEHVV